MYPSHPKPARGSQSSITTEKEGEAEVEEEGDVLAEELDDGEVD